MNRKLLMAVDLGTSFVKAGVFDLEGRELAVAKEAIRSEQPATGQFIQHGDDLMEAVERCIRSAVETLGEQARNIASIGFTGQMAGFMDRD